MAITVADKATNQSTSNVNSYATASITTVASRLYTAAIFNTRGSADPDLPTLTSTGLTWVNIATTGSCFGAVTVRGRISMYRAMSTGGTSVVTIATTNTNTACAWSILEWDGVDTGGTNGSLAIDQSIAGTSAATTTLTLTLGSALEANSAGYGCYCTNASTTFSPEATYTELPAAELNNVTPSVTFGAMYKLLSTDTTLTGTVGASGELGGVAVEIKEAAAAAASRAVRRRQPQFLQL